MSILSDSIATSQEVFIEGLCARGFTLLNDCRTLVGNIDINGHAVEHQIALTDDFPITKPHVSTTGGEGGLSWHRESDGRFCLWSDDEASHLPWADADTVINRISQWHANEAAGWPDDPPDLDLERYWKRSPVLIVYPDLVPLTGKTCKAKNEAHNVLRIMKGQANKNRGRRRGLGAAVIDIGELQHPVHTFYELSEMMALEDAEKLRAGIEKGSIKVLMVRYTRQGHEAAIGLIAENCNPHLLKAASAAHTGASTRNLRAGLDAETLCNTKIAIIGLGAIGSLLAEMLVRSGVGGLTLVDGDTIRPGNCIRHVATLNDVGRNKAEVVRDRIIAAGLIPKREATDKVTVKTQMLQSVTEVEELFFHHNLVVDATGNGPATALIWTASRILDKPSVTVCLQRGGTVSRVDRLPLRHGENHDKPVPPGGPSVVLREGGCGDPVSPTPPWACAAAAARAAGMAADLLAGRDMYPPTVIDVLIGHPVGPRIVDGR